MATPLPLNIQEQRKQEAALAACAYLEKNYKDNCHNRI